MEWGLRDYGVKGQIGLEKTPEEYVIKLKAVFKEVFRILKKNGTFWLNIGDTYGGSRCGSNDYREEFSLSKPKRYDKPSPQAQIKPKCLLMIPERLAFATINSGFILRNKIIWYKPNAMPSSVKDRFSNCWEYLYLLSKARKYYFDLDAIREPHTNLPFRKDKGRWQRLSSKHENIKSASPSGIQVRVAKRGFKSKRGKVWPKGNEQFHGQDIGYNPKGKNPGDIISVKQRIGDVHTGEATANLYLPHKTHHKLGKNPSDFWSISTKPFPKAHFAVFPEKLCERPIKAGCPKEVCSSCGKPRERIIESPFKGDSRKIREDHPHVGHLGRPVQGAKYEGKTIGFTKCGCNVGFQPGIVLDPFCGSGTALVVAKKLGRNYIGIDIKPEYVEMAKKRLNKVPKRLDKFIINKTVHGEDVR